jgi:hypothetical protein
MTTQTIKENNSVEVLIPFFCYCCAPGSHKLSDVAYKKFVKSDHKVIINTEILKSEFDYVKDVIQNPSDFGTSINYILNKLKSEYSKTEASVLINSIKRIISIIAKDMELDERSTKTTTHLVISDHETYMIFIQQVLGKIECLAGVAYTVYGKGQVAFCPFISENEYKIPITEVMISNVLDYWNTTSFRKNKKS